MKHRQYQKTQWPLAGLALAVGMLSACDAPVETSYGRRSQLLGGQSVNGTSVLAHMFQQAGHKVHSWSVLSPAVHRADVIVWFPDRFRAPRPEARQWLTRWLSKVGGRRKLIYVGRDYDAAVPYWSRVKVLARDQYQKDFVNDRLLDAEQAFRSRWSRLPKSENAGWFTLRRWDEQRSVDSLSGSWAEQVDPARADLVLRSEMDPAGDTEVLLESGSSSIVCRRSVGDGQLWLVANGCFLVNLGLINHEHRRMAGRLIDAVGPAGQNVLFLESGPDGVEINTEDPGMQMKTGLEIFNVWPINYVVLHLAIFGTAYCFSRFPLFGRPRDPPQPDTINFGNHIDALGELLRKSRDYHYAQQAMSRYRNLLDPETTSHE